MTIPLVVLHRALSLLLGIGLAPSTVSGLAEPGPVRADVGLLDSGPRASQASLGLVPVAARTGKPQAVASCTRVKRRPERLSWCDSSDHVMRIRWSRWGRHAAVGRGTFVNNTCVPSCAEGSYERFRVRIRLHRVRRAGQRLRFTRARFDNRARGPAVYWMPRRPL